MLRGSDLKVPAVKLTRRIFPAHDMFVLLKCWGQSTFAAQSGLTHKVLLSSQRLVTQFVCPLRHLAKTGPVGIDESNGTGGAGIGTSRAAFAEVALLHLAGSGDVIDRAKRAGDGADLAADTDGLVDHLGASRLVHANGRDRTGMQAPGFIALGAGVGHFLAGHVKVKNLDTRFGGGERAVVVKRTGHFALHTASALVRVDVQHLLHVSLLWVIAPMKCRAYEIEYIAIVGRLGLQFPRGKP